MNDKIVILVHGFINSSRDMISLENFLKKNYNEVISVNLPTTFVSMDIAVSKLSRIIRNIPNNKSIIFICHSMGGLIACRSIYELQLKNIDKCIFIATPFKGSKVANFGDKIPFYSRILKPNKELKVTDKYLFTCNSVATKLPVGLIAGNKYSKFNILARLCLSKDHDGLVEVASAFAIKSYDRIVLNKSHREIHHDAETFEKVNNFLKNKKF